MKDSSSNLDHTRQVIAAFPEFAVFPGAEVYLVKALAAGAAGCISATANINAAAIAELINRWQDPDADQHQAALNAVRKTVDRYDRIAAIKAVLAARNRDTTWLNVRPPLMQIDPAARSALLSDSAIVALLEGAKS